MPQASSAELADIFSFEGERAIGEPTRYQIRFTHPQPDLSRTDYLNKPAAFVIQPPFNPLMTLKPEPERRVQGVITGFSQRGSSRDETTYEVVLDSRLALLRNTPKCRFFLEKSFPEIIEQILREHGFDRIHGSFEFNLYRTYRKRSFVMQWGEDDLTFITRLCRRSGIWFVCEEGERCENVRFGDDFTHYRRNPNLTVPYRQFSGLESSGTESVDSLEMDATTLPTSYKVRTFSTERPVSEPIEAVCPITGDRTTYGEAYTWGTPDLSQDEAGAEALLRREAAVAAQVVYRGTCNMLDLAPSCVLKFSNRKLPDAEYGLVTVRVKCSASRKQPYRVEFTAIPSDRLYRLSLLEHTWPRIEGVITGTIASPGGYKDPYLDAQGSYIVHIHADQDKRTPGLESCPMRLAKPFAGAGQTGFHFGLVEGTIVTVGFLWGCPDLPFISQVLHTAQDTDPVNSAYPWATRNTLRTRMNNTLQFEDRAGREHIKLATEHGKTQLSLGHAVDRENEERGAGYELRTDMKGHLRAGGGMLVSTYMQEKARGPLTDMDAMSSQFNVTQAQAQGLANAGAMAKAEIADLKAENEWLKNELVGLKEAVIALSAPRGIGMATPSRFMVSSGKDTSFATSSGFNVSALKNIALAAVEAVSVFAQRAGIRLLAMRGKVQIQAQADAMELVSQLNMQLSSVAGTLTANAANGIVLSGGGTAYIKIQGDNVEIGGAGDLIIKVPDIDKAGAGAVSLPLPKFNQTDAPSDERFILSDHVTGRPLANRPYKVQTADGRIVEGVTNDKGETSLTQNDIARGIKLLLSKIKRT
ncbi:type VI secretion system tip protein VgrG [Paraburkholderia sp. 5N]|uniref:Type VI secretion system tip protein VgrG n=2 Tax=Paraburkholderia elongata TaxID=2675747 RepID=A0A972SNP3_9BURK|nr:type VI secretion system tip protein VgrG [Paraburkholderia elongata]